MPWYAVLKETMSDANISELEAVSINTPTNSWDNFNSSGGSFQINSEIFTYTGIQGNKFIGVLRAQQGTMAVIHSAGSKISNVYDFRWKLAYKDTISCNGYIAESNANSMPQKLGFTTDKPLRNIRPGSFVKFTDPDGMNMWTSIQDIKGDGLGVEDANNEYTGILANGMGPVEVNKVVTEDQVLRSIIPSFTRTFDDATREIILKRIHDKKSFALQFDNLTPRWTVLPETTSIDITNPFDRQNDSTNWLLYVQRGISGWTIVMRQLDYIFGSEELIRFYNINYTPSFNPSFRSISKDSITVIGVNALNNITEKQTYRISGYYVYDDGYTDNSKVKVTPLDLDNDLLPDDPRHFLNVVGANDKLTLINYDEGNFSYIIPAQTVTTEPGLDIVDGRMGLAFKWTHTVPADQTLDPSLTNIIDVYVLNKSYNEDYNVWKRKNNSKITPPLPPTSEELRNNFTGLLSYKMMTDEIIFHPVKFKPLFGTLADAEFQAQFKVVKTPRSKLTDSEIKSKVVAAIDVFFTPGNFGFGEIFYFTELAAYLHTSLNTELSSVVIVPISNKGRFGTLFQIQPDRNEIVTSVASVNDIIVINEITDNNIRIGK
jgi:hypothetical protein